MPKQVQAFIVSADGKRADFKQIATDLDTLQGIVGGSIQVITPSNLDAGAWHAYVDEEAKLKGVPVNSGATGIATHLGWAGQEWGDYLCGAVVFLGSDGSSEADLPAETVTVLRRMFGLQIEGQEVCQWFAGCGNPATGTTPHPVLGDVPTCDRCAERATS